ncbi:MAG: sulfatase-like hydrolase/transferase [Pirellulales bacterium]
MKRITFTYFRWVISPVLLLAYFCLNGQACAKAFQRPHIILVMADDMGWGQTGYYGHPFLKTPNLDEMAASGLRLDRFYAGGPVCSPTRATVLTGRTHERTGVMTHGYALRLQERTIPQALAEIGYTTAHFGKWHLNGIRGAGIPILPNDSHRPDVFGFQHWLSVTNFFDMNPLMGRRGKPKGVFEKKQGDSSEVVVSEALKFLNAQIKGQPNVPTFTVIWFGTPHSPWASEEFDREPFEHLSFQAKRHYGELVAMDRSIGRLRQGLRKLGIAEQTLLWFTSDNGGLPNKDFQPTVGQPNDDMSGMTTLRGFKGSVYEGGLRVPAIIEWPETIRPRVSAYQSGAFDIFPTILDIVGLSEESMLPVRDGISIKPLFLSETGSRVQPMGFRYAGKGALIDGDYKLVISTPTQKKSENPARNKKTNKGVELFNLLEDPGELKDLASQKGDVLKRLLKKYQAFCQSVDESMRGCDYASGKLDQPDPEPKRWTTDETIYSPFLSRFNKEQRELDALTKPKRGS